MALFKWNWLQRHRFALERSRQRRENRVHFIQDPDPEAATYWRDVGHCPLPDAEQEDLLTPLARTLAGPAPKQFRRDFRTRAPEDIYPVF